MPRFEPYNLQLQLARMFVDGQSFFAAEKVRDWLRERNQNPDDYEILFHEKPAPPGDPRAIAIEVELQRRDGQPTDEWLQSEANRV